MVKQLQCFFRLPLTERLSLEQGHQYISQLDASREKWQVKQAEQALRRYDYFLTKVLPDVSPVQADPASWGIFHEEMPPIVFECADGKAIDIKTYSSAVMRRSKFQKLDEGLTEAVRPDFR